MMKAFFLYGSIGMLVCASSLSQAQSTCTYLTNPTNCLPVKATTNSSTNNSTDPNAYASQNQIPNTNYSSGNTSGTAGNVSPNFGYNANNSTYPYLKQNVDVNTNSNAGAKSNSGTDQNSASNSNVNSTSTSSSTQAVTPALVPTPNTFNVRATPAAQPATPGRRSSLLETPSLSATPLIVNNNITDNGILRSSQQSISTNPNSLASIKPNNLSNAARNGALTNSYGGLSTDNNPKQVRRGDDDSSDGKLNTRPAPITASSALRSGSTGPNKDSKNTTAKDPKKKPACIYLDNAEICGPS